LAILKIKDGGGGHLENQKSHNISAFDRPVLKKFSMVMFLILPTTSAYKILCF